MHIDYYEFVVTCTHVDILMKKKLVFNACCLNQTNYLIHLTYLLFQKRFSSNQSKQMSDLIR